MNASTSADVVGWQADGGGRGTWTLLWTTLTTIFLAVVVAYHPPAGYRPSEDSRFSKFIDASDQWWRVVMALYGLVIPEFLVTVALGEFMEARDLRNKIRQYGYPMFTLQEAFFASMGAYRMKLLYVSESSQITGTSRGTRKDFVLKHTHIAWLVQNGIVIPPKDDVAEAKEKHSTEVQNPRPRSKDIVHAEDGSKNPDDSKTEHSTSSNANTPQAYLLDPWTIEQRGNSSDLAKAIVLLQCVYFIINCIGRGANQLPLSLLEVLVLSYIVLTFVSYAVWWYKPQNVHEPLTFDLELTQSHRQELYALNDDDEWSTGVAPGGEGLSQPTDNERSLPKPIFVQFWFFIVTCWASAGIHFAAWNYDFPTSAEKTAWRVLVIVLITFPVLIVADSRILVNGHGRLFSQKVNGWLQFVFALVGVAAKIGLFVLALMSLRAAPSSLYDTWEISNWLLFWV